MMASINLISSPKLHNISPISDIVWGEYASDHLYIHQEKVHAGLLLT
jgi:hypothetical protein